LARLSIFAEEDCLLWAFDVLLIFGVCFHSVFLFLAFY